MSNDRIPTELRQLVIDRAHGCCEYCYSQSRFSMQSFSVEHIRPVSKAGFSTEDNLALSCQGCNNHKYNKTDGYDPITVQKVALFHPRQQNWSDHFIWNEDYSLIIGITSIGRATVEVLHLNRDDVVNLRQVYIRWVNIHPVSWYITQTIPYNCRGNHILFSVQFPANGCLPASCVKYTWANRRHWYNSHQCVRPA